MTNNTNFTLCDSCSNILDKYHRSIPKQVELVSEFVEGMSSSCNFVIGDHGFEKGMYKGLSFMTIEEKKVACQGEIVEVQKGKNEGEFKIIVLNTFNDEPLHFIFLKQPHKKLATLINVYNPTEDMSFKWSEDGKRRLYLNSFRSCCQHPEDKKENHFKKHHGVQHAPYAYQMGN